MNGFGGGEEQDEGESKKNIATIRIHALKIRIVFFTPPFFSHFQCLLNFDFFFTDLFFFSFSKLKVGIKSKIYRFVLLHVAVFCYSCD